MSLFHCSCGFAIDAADEYGDHLEAAFARLDDIGIDGQVHLELAGTASGMRTCACGFFADGIPEFDDHLLMVFVASDGIGSDGERHVPVGTSTPDRWYVRKADDE